MVIPITKQFKTRIDQEGRVCTACGVYKKWIDYKPAPKSKSKFTSKCKGCYKEKRKASGRKGELYSSKNRRQWLKNNNPFQWKSSLIRNRLLAKSEKDKKKEVPTREVIETWLKSSPLLCYYSGLELSIYDVTIDHKQPTSRGGSNKIENLCIASNHMNTAKGKMTELEFLQLLKLISSWEDSGEGLLKRLKQGYF